MVVTKSRRHCLALKWVCTAFRNKNNNFYEFFSQLTAFSKFSRIFRSMNGFCWEIFMLKKWKQLKLTCRKSSVLNLAPFAKPNTRLQFGAKRIGAVNDEVILFCFKIRNALVFDWMPFIFVFIEWSFVFKLNFVIWNVD